MQEADRAGLNRGGNRPGLKIMPVRHLSPYLQEVIKLWRAHSATLGYFPEGAFADYARRGWIFIALSAEKKCVGYLAYRISNNQAKIVHLCVDPGSRGRGVARALVQHLYQETRHLEGIGLWCRRDYEAHSLWPHLGFVAKSDRQGRSYTGRYLTFWWLDHGHPNLFTRANEERLASKLKAVMDANVFYDLNAEPSLDNEESKALVADWLQDSIELCLTDEIYNEIDRNRDPHERKRQRTLASRFTHLPCKLEDMQKVITAMRSFFPSRMSPSQASDLRHIARAVGGGAQFFITRDENLLARAEDIYQTCGISVVRPCDLIIHLDAFSKEAKYQPARLAGSLVRINLLPSGQGGLITRLFCCYQQGESKTEFRRNLNRFLSDPETFETNIVNDVEQNPLALVVYARPNRQELQIPMIRVANGPLARALAQRLIFYGILNSGREKRVVTKVTDKYLCDVILETLQGAGFFSCNGAWTKINLPVVEKTETITAELLSLAARCPDEHDHLLRLATALQRATEINDVRTVSLIEKYLWPAKVLDADIPSFIVPIQPRWAMHLFDEDLARQNLFGAKAEVALAQENVYYRAARPKVLSAPGRILWYVSQEEGCPGSKHVRACSILDELVIGKPKDLFRRFRRLGIYEWRDVLALAKNDISRDIIAIQFSNTELFSNPIPWQTLQQVLREERGRGSQIQSPIRISNGTFMRLYQLGQA